MASGTKEIIISGACRIIDAQGFENVNLKTIGETYGLTLESIEKYYKNNNDLLCDIARLELEALFNNMPQMNESNIYSNMLGVFNNYLMWARKYPNRYFLIFRRWDNYSQEFSDNSNKLRKIFIETINKYITRPVKKHSPEKIAYFIFSVCIGATTLELMGHFNREDKTPITSAEEMVTMLMALLVD